MPLKIELKPNERLIIGNAAIRNGERRASFVLETNTRFLRESDFETARHPDGIVVEYVQWTPELVEQFIRAPQRAGKLASEI